DAIEISALKTAFADLQKQNEPHASAQAHCGLGSVKSNIGHLELAAGITGVIKVLLQFKHRVLVKTLNSEPENPYLKLEQSPFYVVKENTPWHHLKDAQGKDLPRRAGVSSFGFVGVNAHVLLEEYLPPNPDTDADTDPLPNTGPFIVPLSAKDGDTLRAQASALLRALSHGTYNDSDLPS